MKGSLFLFMSQNSLWKRYKTLASLEGLHSVSKPLIIMEQHQLSDKTQKKSLTILKAKAGKAACLPFV